MCAFCKEIKKQKLMQMEYITDYFVKQIGFESMSKLKLIAYYRQRLN